MKNLAITIFYISKKFVYHMLCILYKEALCSIVECVGEYIELNLEPYCIFLVVLMGTLFSGEHSSLPVDIIFR